MNAVDTNALIYVHDPRDPAKQSIANSLVNSLSDGVLLWQVACLEGGVAGLYAEDFDAYSKIESLSLINPFKIP